ncbi:MAG: hypothetical protein CMK07_09665 [Ponticaulis sp.]|nr:hypothetical protein [Ponticaulis sp.]
MYEMSTSNAEHASEWSKFFRIIVGLNQIDKVRHKGKDAVKREIRIAFMQRVAIVLAFAFAIWAYAFNRQAAWDHCMGMEMAKMPRIGSGNLPDPAAIRVAVKNCQDAGVSKPLF